jgi:L-cysteine desulfidase
VPHQLPAMGAAAGMALLLGNGHYKPIDTTICSMIGDLTGIVCDSVETSINNLGAIVSQSMKVTDTQIIDIMSHKA